jgi:hypothetical protein
MPERGVRAPESLGATEIGRARIHAHPGPRSDKKTVSFAQLLRHFLKALFQAHGRPSISFMAMMSAGRSLCYRRGCAGQRDDPAVTHWFTGYRQARRNA